MTNAEITTRIEAARKEAFPHTLRVNRGDWSGKEITVRYLRTENRVTFQIGHFDDVYTIERHFDEECGADYEVYRNEDREPMFSGFDFSRDGTDAHFDAFGIERDACGENADIIAATQVICNII